MKYFFLNLLLIITYIPSISAQKEYTKAIKSTVEAYFTELEEEDIEGVVSHLYPRLFKCMPEKKIRDELQTTFADEGQVSVRNPEIFEVSDLVDFKGISYAKVIYQETVALQLMEKAEGELEGVNLVGVSLELLKASFGPENVTLVDEATQTFQIRQERTLYAILHSDYQEWKLLESERKEGLGRKWKKLIPRKLGWW